MDFSKDKELDILEKQSAWNDWTHTYEAGVICSICGHEVNTSLDIYWENAYGDGVVEHVCKECWLLGEQND